MSQPAEIRAFIAIDLSAEVLKSLEQGMAGLVQKSRRLPVRWTPTKNIHITLKFLGNVPAGDVEALKGALQLAAGGCPRFSIEVGGLGAFPNRQKPRVVWVGVQAPAGLDDLQRAVDAHTAPLGHAPEDRPFSPHLTVGRVSNRAGPQEVRQIGEVLVNYPLGKLGITSVSAVHLYRSELTPAGSIYTRLFSGNLIS